MDVRAHKAAGTWRYGAAIILLGFIVYAKALHGGFIWDDDAYIKSNAGIKDITRIGSLFSQRVGEGYTGRATPSPFYRPLQMALYAVAYAFWGPAPLVYHLLNVLLHIGVALCLFGLIAHFFADRQLAGLAALLYVAHPAHVEVVANATGTADPLSALLLLLSFICYAKACASPRGPLLAGAVFFFSGALLAKENALVFPLALLFYHYVFQKKVRALLFLPVAGVALCYLMLRAEVLDTALVDTARFASMLPRVPGFFVGLAAYVRILFFPVGLHVYYGDLLFTFADARAWLGAAFFGLLLGAVVRCRKRETLFAFAAGWFLIFLLPVTNIYKVNDSFIKEHWLYLPSAGFFLVLARALLDFYRRGGGRRRVLGLGAMVLILAFYAASTVGLCAYWSDPLTFLKRSIHYYPGYAVFYNELGVELEERGRPQEAADLYLEALRRDPGLTAVYSNLGRSLARAGRYAEAVGAYRRFLAHHPEEVSVYFAVAGCYDKMGRQEEAGRLLEEGRRKGRELTQKYALLAEELRAAGRWKEAIAAYRKSLSFVSLPSVSKSGV